MVSLLYTLGSTKQQNEKLVWTGAVDWVDSNPSCLVVFCLQVGTRRPKHFFAIVLLFGWILLVSSTHMLWIHHWKQIEAIFRAIIY